MCFTLILSGSEGLRSCFASASARQCSAGLARVVATGAADEAAPPQAKAIERIDRTVASNRMRRSAAVMDARYPCRHRRALPETPLLRAHRDDAGVRVGPVHARGVHCD